MIKLLLISVAVQGIKYCSILNDEFESNVIDANTWRHEISMFGGGNWEFEWFFAIHVRYTNNRTNSFVEDGVLYLKPTLTFDHLGPSMINGGQLDLWAEGCTNNGFYGCSRGSNGQNIINPIQSAQLRTINSVSMAFGKVEVRAKMPVGDWIWPAIWMLPKHQVYGSWPASGEIDIMESRGNKPGCQEVEAFPDGSPKPISCHPGRDTFGSTLHWGTDYTKNRFNMTRKAFKLPDGKSLSDDFHTFGLLWTKESLKTYIDTEENVVLEVPFNQDFYQKGNFPSDYKNPWKGATKAAPFDQEFYLVMNVAVGGVSGYFYDNVDSKPWSDGSTKSALDFWNARDKWLPTWPDDNSRSMAIDSVKMWKEC